MCNIAIFLRHQPAVTASQDIFLKCYYIYASPSQKDTCTSSSLPNLFDVECLAIRETTFGDLIGRMAWRTLDGWSFFTRSLL